MDVFGIFIQGVEADQAVIANVLHLLDMPRLHARRVGKGRQKWRAAVMIAQHQADRQRAGRQRLSQPGIFGGRGIMGEIAAEHDMRGIGMAVQRMRQPMAETRMGIEADNRPALGQDMDVSENEDLLHVWSRAGNPAHHWRFRAPGKAELQDGGRACMLSHGPSSSGSIGGS